VLAGIVGLVPLSVPLADLFGRLPLLAPSGTSFNLVGLSIFALWSAVVIAALVTSLRAREEDPTFRGLYSEGVRMTAVLLFVLVLATWITIDVTNAIEQRGPDPDCIEFERYTWCRIDLSQTSFDLKKRPTASIS
jgi:hypothetical protein